VRPAIECPSPLVLEVPPPIVKETAENMARKSMPAGPGRPKGVPNKLTTLAKDAIAAAAEKLGGTDRLVEWARESPDNEKVFWGQIYTKLLPLQVHGPGPDGEHLIRKIERAIIDPKHGNASH